jgi:SUKH-3 immunity protein
MFKFDPRVEAVLLQSGWTPTRSISIWQWIDPLEREGFVMVPQAKEILRNLGGLRIEPPTSPSNLFYPSAINFDPYFAASSELDRVQLWQERYGLRLSPLGEYHPVFLLLCGEDGTIFGAREHKFDKLGNNIEEALEVRVLANRRPTPVEPVDIKRDRNLEN